MPSYKPSEFAMPSVTTKQFEDIIKEIVQYCITTGRWSEQAPIYGHGSPGIGKSAIAEGAIRAIEEITGQKTHLHIIEANQLEIGEFGYNIADMPGRVTFAHVAALYKDFKCWVGSFLPKFWQGKIGEYQSEVEKLAQAEADALPIAKWFRNGKYPDPNSEDCHLVLIEELGSALPSQQALLHALLLNRRAGQTPLPKKTIIIAVGNLVTDKGHVMEITSPVANRCQHYEVSIDTDRWLEIAVQNQIDPLITSFHRNTKGIRLSPQGMTQYGPGNYAFGTGRSWFAAHETLQILKMKREGRLGTSIDEKQFFEELRYRMQSHVGSASAIEFAAFVESVNDAPDINKILSVANIDDLDKYVPQRSSDDRENGRKMGMVYFMLDAISQQMAFSDPAKDTKARDIWERGLWFMKKVAAIWGNNIAVIGVLNIKSVNPTMNMGNIAIIGGSEIVAWLGKDAQGNFEARKILQNELIAR